MAERKKRFSGLYWQQFALTAGMVMLTLLLLAGWNHTAFYPSLADMQSSLTIRNASSSEFTLRVMSYVSLLVPVVVGYIWYAWRRLNRIRITREGLSGEEHTY